MIARQLWSSSYCACSTHQPSSRWHDDTLNTSLRKTLMMFIFMFNWTCSLSIGQRQQDSLISCSYKMQQWMWTEVKLERSCCWACRQHSTPLITVSDDQLQNKDLLEVSLRVLKRWLVWWSSGYMCPCALSSRLLNGTTRLTWMMMMRYLFVIWILWFNVACY